jgi:DNA-directed RNA polymerase subunit H
MAVEAKKLVNIQNHILVPKHTILSETESAELLTQYNISPTQLPVILATDPIVKAIGAKPGQIIKIERKEQTRKSIYYRRVV